MRRPARSCGKLCAIGDSSRSFAGKTSSDCAACGTRARPAVRRNRSTSANCERKRDAGWRRSKKRKPMVARLIWSPEAGPYLILFETGPDTDEGPVDAVEILRVVDGRRDLTNLV